MRALTVKQPWAWLIINGSKNIENRSWGPGKALGWRIAIHAGLRIDHRGYELARRLGVDPPPLSEIERGAIVGTVVVTGVVESSLSPWFIGPKGWELADPRPCEPIPAKGRLGLWSIAAPPG